MAVKRGFLPVKKTLLITKKRKEKGLKRA